MLQHTIPDYENRRVYKKEFSIALGCGATWLQKLIDRGTIPRGLIDPGGRRVWWPKSTVDAVLAKMVQRAVPAPQEEPKALVKAKPVPKKRKGKS